MRTPHDPRAPCWRRAAGVASLILAAALAKADWDPDDPAKWVQYPDLTSLGMDVKAFVWNQLPNPACTLADDWLCTVSEPITNIHVWGSWYHDLPPQQNPGNVVFILAIHSDIPDPDGPGPLYSHPGPVLWAATFWPGTFVVRPYNVGPEGWFDPVLPYFEPNSDNMCWQYNFPVASNPFFQEGMPTAPVVYWLEVQAYMLVEEPGTMFGWKISTDHWNDAAVCANTVAPNADPTSWKMLINPLSGEVIDLAFVINGGQPPPPPLDFGDAPDGFTAAGYPTYLVNDGARHKMVGSLFFGVLVDSEADGQPTAAADGDDNNGVDDEDGVSFLTPFYRYETAKMKVTASAAGALDAWIDLNADKDWNDAGEQMAASLAVTAGVNIVSFTVPGTASNGLTYARFRLSSAGGLLPTGLAENGEVEDYAVMIEDRFPPLVGPKWTQPPDLRFGIDIPSWGYEQGFGPYLVADDWWCDGRPIDAIRWWGSYLDYSGPSNAPSIPVGGTRPWGFRLHWYSDVPATNSPTGYSMPGAELLSRDFLLLSFSASNTYDAVKEAYAGTVDLTFLGPPYLGELEHKFRYDLYLEDSWNEKAGTIYWLGIEALYDGAPRIYPWGWSTTPVLRNWNDDAVVRTNDVTGAPVWGEMTYLPNVSPYNTLHRHPYLGKSVNMAYQLLSRVRPRRSTIWCQPPDMVLGTDLASWRSDPMPPGYGPTLRADDWQAEGRRVSDIHWWGSYINWKYGIGEPVPPPLGLFSPLGFKLSWHADGLKQPGTALTNLFLPLEYCHQTYYCCVTQEWIGVFEHEYQYYVDLLDPRVSGEAWAVATNEWYWLDIQAVFSPGFIPSEREHCGWGWKTTSDVQGIPSVVATNNSPPFSWEIGTYPLGHPKGGQPADLAFELTTDQLGTSQPVIVSIKVPATATVQVAGVGDAGGGEQQLRMDTDLTNATFSATVDFVNPPVPPPWTNWFETTVATNVFEFYRIYQVAP